MTTRTETCSRSGWPTPPRATLSQGVGCGGLRKVRVGDPRRAKGKRGGARVVYLDIPEAERIDLITIYSKEEQQDLTSTEKKLLRKLVAVLRTEAIAAFRRGSRPT